LLLFGFYLIEKSKIKTIRIINYFTPLVENAKTLDDVMKVWKELMVYTTKPKSDEVIIFKLDFRYFSDFMRLYTICETKYKTLKQK
jgi:hypothetical protein